MKGSESPPSPVHGPLGAITPRAVYLLEDLSNMKLLFTIFALGLSIVSGKIYSQSTDTIFIYKNKSNIGHKVYLRHWFFTGGSYSYSPRLTEQDSIVMYPKKAYYYKYFTEPNGKLILEGKSSDLGCCLKGDIKFYYSTGQLQRIEHWDNDQHLDTCGTQINIADAPIPEGKWTYFRKDGSKKKEINFIIKVVNCQPLKYDFIKQTITFDKKSNKNVEYKTVGDIVPLKRPN